MPAFRRGKPEGEYFTSDVAAAWSTAYGILADVMKAAAAEVDEAMRVAAR
jgi:hemoglobin-like flavoprotein